MKLVVTGATGFLGRAFVAQAVAAGHDVVALTRVKAPDLGARFMIPSDWNSPVLLAKAMEGRDALIHLAGLAHGKPGDMNAVNVELTRVLAEAAKQAQLPHFLFVSSAAVFGGSGEFAPDDAPNPATPYGESKAEAESVLCEVLAGSGTKLTILRPPIVVGAHAPGHAETIRRILLKGWPLPFGRLTARRSFIPLEHLAAKMVHLVSSVPERSTLRHVAEGPVTATELIRKIAEVDGLKAHMLPLPAFLLKPLGLIPVLRGKLSPLLTDHVLLAGQHALD